ncbi:MAG: T9SS type A sorting domain-containing protein [Bacteroidales bacterium]|nr:T9SS type A sorting domain-containing protein [Bacteroidales bacterium]
MYPCNTKPGLNIFPNPSNGEITLISGSGTTMYFYNSLGKLLCAHKVDKGVNHINTSWLGSGLFIIRAHNSSLHTKLIINP